MVMKVFSCRKNAIFPGAHQIGAAISGHRIAGKEFYGPEVCSEGYQHFLWIIDLLMGLFRGAVFRMAGVP